MDVTVLKYVRRKLHLTVQEAADGLIVGKSSLERYERAGYLKDTDMIEVLANFYGISFDLLMHGTDDLESIQIPDDCPGANYAAEIHPDIDYSRITTPRAEIKRNQPPMSEVAVADADTVEKKKRKKLHPVIRTGLITFGVSFGIAVLIFGIWTLFSYSYRPGVISTFRLLELYNLVYISLIFVVLTTALSILSHLAVYLVAYLNKKRKKGE